MILPKFKIQTLNKKLMEVSLNSIISIDSFPIGIGLLEKWNKENYLVNFLDKWQLSKAVFYNDNLIGYRIVSGNGKIKNYSHAHRVCVDPIFRNKGIGKILLHETELECIRLGYSGITTFSYLSNAMSFNLLKNSGYKIKQNIDGNKIMLFKVL